MITASGRFVIAMSFLCCCSSESPRNARMSSSNRRVGTARWSRQATICPTESQGRKGSPMALDPPSTTIRYSPASGSGNEVGMTGRRCIQFRQAAEPISSAASENRHEKQSRKTRTTAEGRLPRRGDRTRSHAVTGTPMSPASSSALYTSRTPRRKLSVVRRTTARGSKGIQPGSTTNAAISRVSVPATAAIRRHPPARCAPPAGAGFSVLLAGPLTCKPRLPAISSFS